MSDVQVTHQPDQQRYAVTVDGQPAGFAAYLPDDGRLVLTHTEVDDAYEGQGVGSTLARDLLADVRRQGLTVVPECPFIREWIDRHPDHQDLVDPSAGTTSG